MRRASRIFILHTNQPEAKRTPARDRLIFMVFLKHFMHSNSGVIFKDLDLITQYSFMFAFLYGTTKNYTHKKGNLPVTPRD